MSSTTKVRAVLCRVGQEPEVIEVEPTPEDIKAAIGLTHFDAIDATALGPGVHVYIDDDGAIRANPQPNRCELFGDFIVMAAGRDGDERSLTDEEVRKVLAWAEKGKNAQPAPRENTNGFTVHEFASFEAMESYLGAVRQAKNKAWDAL